MVAFSCFRKYCHVSHAWKDKKIDKVKMLASCQFRYSEFSKASTEEMGFSILVNNFLCPYLSLSKIQRQIGFLGPTEHVLQRLFSLRRWIIIMQEIRSLTSSRLQGTSRIWHNIGLTWPRVITHLGYDSPYKPQTQFSLEAPLKGRSYYRVLNNILVDDSEYVKSGNYLCLYVFYLREVSHLLVLLWFCC